MKRIIYSNPDDTVSVIVPAPQRGLTEDQSLALAKKDIPRNATNIVVIDAESLPPRTNRNLWRWDGTRITVNGVPVSTPSGIKIR